MGEERLTIRVPKGWKKRLHDIAREQYLPDRSALIRKDLGEKYQLKNEARENGEAR